MPNCMERHDQADNCHDYADDGDPGLTTSRVSPEVVVRAGRWVSVSPQGQRVPSS